MDNGNTASHSRRQLVYRVQDISLYQLAAQGLEVSRVAGRPNQGNNRVATGPEAFSHMGPDEPGPAGQEDTGHENRTELPASSARRLTTRMESISWLKLGTG